MNSIAPRDILQLTTLMTEIALRHAVNTSYLRASIEAAARGLDQRRALKAEVLADVSVLIYDVLAAAVPTAEHVDRFAEIAADLYFRGRDR